jgi:hypothetical protein
MTGRSSKSYKHRSGIGYITILWQNLGSATHVTISCGFADLTKSK